VKSVAEPTSKLQIRLESDRSPELRRLGWYHSFAFPDGTQIQGVQSLAQLHERWARFPLPEDLAGKRVLDIGAWDGWFSFEAERRGASVVSLDCVEIPNLLEARERLSSAIDYRISNLYKLPSLGLGRFDYVLFLGVLYHVKHPLLALQMVCALTLDIAIVESAVTDGPAYRQGVREEIPTLEFFETNELGGHFDNWFAPSVSCLMAMCRAAGFARVELLNVTGATACVACFRHWPEVQIFADVPAPELVAVANNADMGINVATANDDYLGWWFHYGGNLTRHDLEMEAGGFGCHAVTLTKGEADLWLAATVVPPGISPGWSDGRMRISGGSYSGRKRFAVDITVRPRGPLVIESVQDALDWKAGQIQAGSSHAILWISGLADNADRANVQIECNGVRLVVDFVGTPDAGGGAQVNARLTERLRGGTARFAAMHGGATSNIIEAEIGD